MEKPFGKLKSRSFAEMENRYTNWQSSEKKVVLQIEVIDLSDNEAEDKESNFKIPDLKYLNEVVASGDVQRIVDEIENMTALRYLCVAKTSPQILTSSSDMAKAIKCLEAAYFFFVEIGQVDEAIKTAFALVSISESLLLRIKSPYELHTIASGIQLYYPINPAILPLENHDNKLEQWRFICKHKKTIQKKGTLNGHHFGATFEPVEPKEYKDLFPAQFDLEEKMANEKYAEYDPGSPLISRAIRNLKEMTTEQLLRTVIKQHKDDDTDDRMFNNVADGLLKGKNGAGSLLSSTVLIFYNSIYTVLLDNKGNPLDDFQVSEICPPSESAILAPTYDTQDNFRRNIPPPPKGNATTTYINLYPLIGFTFALDRGKVEQMSFRGIGGFPLDHPFGAALQGWLDKNHYFIAAVSTSSAFSPQEFSITECFQHAPDIIKASIPYIIDEAVKKFKEPGVIKEMLHSFILDTIKTGVYESVKKKIANYLAKKVFVSANVILNVAEKVENQIFGGDDYKRSRNIIRAVRLWIYGGTPDDQVIAAKILGKLFYQIVEDAVLSIIQDKILKNLGKVAEYTQKKLKAPDTHTDQPDQRQSTDIHTDNVNAEPTKGGTADTNKSLINNRTISPHQQGKTSGYLPDKSQQSTLTNHTEHKAVDVYISELSGTQELLDAKKLEHGLFSDIDENDHSMYIEDGDDLYQSKQSQSIQSRTTQITKNIYSHDSGMDGGDDTPSFSSLGFARNAIAHKIVKRDRSKKVKKSKQDVAKTPEEIKAAHAEELKNVRRKIKIFGNLLAVMDEEEAQRIKKKHDQIVTELKKQKADGKVKTSKMNGILTDIREALGITALYEFIHSQYNFDDEYDIEVVTTIARRGKDGPPVFDVVYKITSQTDKTTLPIFVIGEAKSKNEPGIVLRRSSYSRNGSFKEGKIKDVVQGSEIWIFHRLMEMVQKNKLITAKELYDAAKEGRLVFYLTHSIKGIATDGSVNHEGIRDYFLNRKFEHLLDKDNKDFNF